MSIWQATLTWAAHNQIQAGVLLVSIVIMAALMLGVTWLRRQGADIQHGEEPFEHNERNLAEDSDPATSLPFSATTASTPMPSRIPGDVPMGGNPLNV